MTGFMLDAYGYWLPVSPGALLDYAEEWADWLGSDSLQSVVWNIPVPLTIAQQSNDASLAKIWLGGFVVGVSYDVACRITTMSGRVDTRSFRLVCKRR